MPRTRKPIVMPENPTPEQVAIVEFLRKHPKLALDRWAKESGISEGTIRNALMTGKGRMLGSTIRMLNEGALKLTGKDLGLKLTHAAFLVGKVGAGAEVLMFDGDTTQGHRERIPYPEGVEGPHDLIALEIDGDSMHPLGKGWRVFYRQEHFGVTSDEIGQLCVVKLTDGHIYLKRLHKGYTEGRFNLESWNGPIIMDQEVEWAAKVRAIVPR